MVIKMIKSNYEALAKNKMAKYWEFYHKGVTNMKI